MALNFDNSSSLLQSQLVRFVLVGAFNTAASYGVYAGGIYVGLPYYLASLCSLLFGIFLSFLTQGRLVFESQLKGRFLSYLLMWSMLYLLNIGLIGMLVGFGLNHYAAGLIAAVPVVAFSFVLQKFLVFRKPD